MIGKLIVYLIVAIAISAGATHCAQAAQGVLDVPAGRALSPLTEYRYCGAPVRLKDGSIRRRADVLAAFQLLHPCPSTGLTTGACPGWAKNHDRSLACGGCDAVSNLSWIPTDVKACAGPHCVDRYERKINATAPPQPDTAACANQVVP
ncbi:MAG: hypothetical protein AB9M53_00355 [Leptothrix sp. (in: b-proteobacteria)]